jgi:hypothetical protein
MFKEPLGFAFTSGDFERVRIIGKVEFQSSLGIDTKFIVETRSTQSGKAFYYPFELIQETDENYLLIELIKGLDEEISRLKKQKLRLTDRLTTWKKKGVSP